MNQKSTPKSQQRFEQPYNSTLNIKMYDRDNLYPNNLMLKVADSATASGCLERYADFIEGDGLHSPILAAAEVNRDGQSLNEIHSLLAHDKAQFGGFAMLIQYDIQCRPCGIYHIPFEQCRLVESDGRGNISHIALHIDWSGQKTRNGNRVRVDVETVDKIDVFCPDPAIVAEQIALAGGITNYKGQVYYYSDAGYLVYPKPKFDSAITDISTDTGISNVMNRNARNNFYSAGVVTYYSNDSDEMDDFSKNLQSLQGDNNACKILALAIQNPEEKPEFVEFSGHNFDKDFTATTAAITERIYSAFGQEGWYCLRIGKTGFSGTLIGDIEKEYSKRVKKDQRKLTKAYYDIFSRFAEGMLPEVPTLDALTVKPYSSITTEKTTL